MNKLIEMVKAEWAVNRMKVCALAVCAVLAVFAVLALIF